MRIKETIPTGFTPKRARLIYVDNDNVLHIIESTTFSADLTTPGGVIFDLYVGSGTKTDCTVSVRAYRPPTSGGDPEIEINTTSGGITVKKQ